MSSTPWRDTGSAFALAAPCLLLLWLFTPPRLVSADWPPEGLALSTAPRGQGEVKLVPDGEGGVFAIWVDAQAGNYDIYAQHLSRDGDVVPGWPSAGLPVCTAAGQQDYPHCVPDGFGGVVVAWADTRDGVYYSIYAQRIRPDGTLHPGWTAGGMPVVVGAAWPDRSEFRVSLLALGPDEAGGAYVGFQSFNQNCAPDYGCVGFYSPPSVRHIGAGGALGGASSFGDYDWAGGLDIVPDGVGGAICATFRNTGATQPLWVSRVTSSGTELWTRQLLLGPGSVQTVDLAPDGFGGVFIACGKRPATDPGDVWAQRLTSSGTEASGWPAGGFPVSATHGFQGNPAAAPGEPGHLLLCWEDTRSLNTNNPFQDADLFAQMLGPDGAPLPGWPVNGIPVCSAPRAQHRSQVIHDGLGGAWVTWLDLRDSLASTQSLFATRLTPTGGPAPGWPADGTRIAATVSLYNRTRATLVRSGPDAVIVAWQDARGGGVAQDDVYAQRVVQDVPVAAMGDLIRVVGSPGHVDLLGFVGGQGALRVVLYRRTETSLAAPLATLLPDGEGHVTFRDPDVVAGTRYWYRLGFQGDGREEFSREIAVVVPSEVRLSLIAPYPGPGDGELTASLNLTGSGPATLELLDLSGRRLAQVNLGHLGSGAHAVSFPQSRGLPAGVYLIRLSEGDRSIVRTSCLIR